MTNPPEQSEEFPAPPPETLVEFFRNSPLLGADIDLEREPDYGRDIEL